MKVSVIVPVYNVAQYIEDCLQSIINQTHKDIELILVDDKSPDDSIPLAKQVFAKNNFHNFKIIKHLINGGLSAARNTGITAATGDFISFVDSDDTIEPTMLAEMTAAVDHCNADIVVCNIWRIHLDKTQEKEHWKSNHTGLVDGDVAVKAMLNFGEKAYIWKCLYRKSLFDHIKFSERVYYEDMLIQPLLWKEAKQLYFLQKPFYNYFERSGSITTRVGNLAQYMGIPACFKVLENDFFSDERVSEELRASLLLFTHTWIRNLSLTILSGNLPYAKVREVLKEYGKHATLPHLLKISSLGDKKLATFLTILKISPYLYWKRFSSELLAA